MPDFADKPEIRNRGNTLILMWGIKRSGNHLLRDWIEYQFERPTDNWMNCEVHTFTFNEGSAGEDVNCRVMSLEERPLETLKLVSAQGYKRHKKVVFLRDPFNLFASRIKYFKLEGRDNLKTFTPYLWLEYAKFFEKQLENPDKDIVLISYNEFVQRPAYREQLCKKLGGRFDDTPVNFVNHNSGGSSFDGTKYQYQAQKMQVLDRWRHYYPYKQYRDLFTEEIRHYSKKLFNFEPF